MFVLDKSLQGGLGGIPKWNPRANAGVYLGHSPDHASNVALVLNLATGLVSPQYHVVLMTIFQLWILCSPKSSHQIGNSCVNITLKISG